MTYKTIWDKVLQQDEKVVYEFSIGYSYRKLFLIVSLVISFIFLLTSPGFGIMLALISGFYFGFYLKIAHAYAFTEKRVLIHRGWLSTHTISIDYNKITDVMVFEPFLERMLTKTGNLSINTAGTNYKEVVLRHIAVPYEVRKKLDALKG